MVASHLTKGHAQQSLNSTTSTGLIISSPYWIILVFDSCIACSTRPHIRHKETRATKPSGHKNRKSRIYFLLESTLFLLHPQTHTTLQTCILQYSSHVVGTFVKKDSFEYERYYHSTTIPDRVGLISSLRMIVDIT